MHTYKFLYTQTLCISVVPEPVSNCSIFNITEATASITCIAGWDGGLQQRFRMKVSKGILSSDENFALETHSPRVLAKTSSSLKPEFIVSGLQPDSKYRVRITAINKKGKSLDKFISFITLNSQISADGRAGK